VTKRLRQHWPSTRIVWRDDGHYGRVEAMEWAENDGADYIFSLAGIRRSTSALPSCQDRSNQPKLHTHVSFIYQAGSWDSARKVVARLECSLQPDDREGTATGMRQEVDIRYVVTSLEGTAQHLYEDVLYDEETSVKRYFIAKPLFLFSQPT
jgi:hypothetical protein